LRKKKKGPIIKRKARTRSGSKKRQAGDIRARGLGGRKPQKGHSGERKGQVIGNPIAARVQGMQECLLLKKDSLREKK